MFAVLQVFSVVNLGEQRLAMRGIRACVPAPFMRDR